MQYGSLCNHPKRRETERDILPTLELLESYGYLRQVEPELRGSPGRRPDVVVQVNPACLS